MRNERRNPVRDAYEDYLAGRATFEEVTRVTDRAAAEYQRRRTAAASEEQEDSAPPPRP